MFHWHGITVEFYETEAGTCSVREFLDELKASDPGDFAALLVELAKLRNWKRVQS